MNDQHGAHGHDHEHHGAHGSHDKRLIPLALGAMGVVFGDIGTSPLYAIKECFTGHHALSVTQNNVFGVLSLIFWAVTLVVTIKYVVFIMQADNRGEGGVLALMALTTRGLPEGSKKRYVLAAFGIFGAALFYGDGVITPVMSVLSAVEGLGVAQPSLTPYIVPITIVILVGLFAMQSHGTETVGKLFGPICLLWFVVIAGLGINEIRHQPQVLLALNPYYAFQFLIHGGSQAFFTLGSVVLAVTGAEALYADMGHFGRRPIRMAWLVVVKPALILNYFGQGALILSDPTAVENPFFNLGPDWALPLMIALATMATVIASQAVISGAYSISRQAVQLGYLPRLRIQHTSETEIGQIYLPRVNWLMLGVIILLVIGFASSSNLAAAYGLAVTLTMTIDSCMVFVVMRRLWRWAWIPAAIATASFLTVDLAFLSATAIKIPDGGWFPLMIGVGLFTVMMTWKRGRAILFKRLEEATLPLDSFLKRVDQGTTIRVEGTAIYMTGSRDGVPVAMLHNMKHNKVLHQRVVLLTVSYAETPYVPDNQRIQIESLGKGFYRLLLTFGFMDEPKLETVLDRCGEHGLPIDMMTSSFFLGRETLVPRVQPEMAAWRERLFISMSRNAASATEFFGIPTGRVVELGTQIEL